MLDPEPIPGTLGMRRECIHDGTAINLKNEIVFFLVSLVDLEPILETLGTRQGYI